MPFAHSRPARLGSWKAAALEASVTHGAISDISACWKTGSALRFSSGIIEIWYQRIAQATDDARNRRERKPLRVNALSTFTVRWLLLRLRDFRDGHPEIEVEVTTSNEAVDMTDEAADIIRGGPDTIYGYVMRPFLAEDRRPVCSPAPS